MIIFDLSIVWNSKARTWESPADTIVQKRIAMGDTDVTRDALQTAAMNRTFGTGSSSLKQVLFSYLRRNARSRGEQACIIVSNLTEQIRYAILDYIKFRDCVVIDTTLNIGLILKRQSPEHALEYLTVNYFSIRADEDERLRAEKLREAFSYQLYDMLDVFGIGMAVLPDQDFIDSYLQEWAPLYDIEWELGYIVRDTECYATISEQNHLGQVSRHRPDRQVFSPRLQKRTVECNLPTITAYLQLKWYQANQIDPIYVRDDEGHLLLITEARDLRVSTRC